MGIDLYAMLYEEQYWQIYVTGSLSAHITFREDGTGELTYILLDHVFILAVELTWRALSLPSDTSDYRPEDSRIDVLGCVRMEITLQPELARSQMRPGFNSVKSPNAHHLTEDAFLPRKFTISLEAGSFIPADWTSAYTARIPSDEYAIWARGGRHLKERWARRIVFSESPYPRPAHLKQHGHLSPGNPRPNVERLTQAVEAVARPLPKAEYRSRAMNDISWTWSESCAVM